VSAERVAQDAVAENPGDPAAERLLADALAWKKDYKAAAAAYQKLIDRAPDDIALRVQLAQVLLWSKDYAGAASRLQALIAKHPDRTDLLPPFFSALAANDVPPTPAEAKLAEQLAEVPATRESRDAGFLSNVAWVLHRIGATAAVGPYLDAALALDPTDAQTRKDLAGVLQVVGRVKEALKLFEGLPLTDGDRFRLAGMYATDRQYGPAEDLVRSVLARSPDDRKALRLLADVLSWNDKYKEGGYAESLEVFARLRELDPGDPEIPVRIAEVNLWAEKYDVATKLFQALLTDRFDRPNLWPGFIDAAASEKVPVTSDAKLVLRIDQATAAAARPPVSAMYPFPPGNPFDASEVKAGTLPTRFLSRLAWVLYQTNSKDRAIAVLNAAVARNPADGGVRRELAGVLSALGRFAEARKMYEGIAVQFQTWADSLRVAELFVAERSFDRAEQRLRQIVRTNPTEKAPQLLLADVLIWSKQYPQATALLDQMRRTWPGDPAVEGRAAAALAYGGRPAAALPLFARLLDRDINQPDLWQPFLDAVAAAPADPANAALVNRVIQKMDVALSKNPDRIAAYGLALVRVGQGDRAVAGLQRALALRPESEVLRRRLAETLTAMGRTEEADVQWRILLQRIGQPANVVGQ
jgi:predicted Zn-dependent protease